jgi:hypothetical protein
MPLSFILLKTEFHYDIYSDSKDSMNKSSKSKFPFLECYERRVLQESIDSILFVEAPKEEFAFRNDDCPLQLFTIAAYY